MATLFEQSSDIYVRDRPVGLSERDPDIFRDYAISRDTAISIMPSMEELIADPTFRRSVKEVLGRLTLVDIKVRGEDGAVLVKDPHAPDSQYEEVDFRARAAVREVSNRTQAAYRRLMGSPSSSCETSPRRVSSPVYDHTAPTARPYQSRSYHHIPSPTVRPEFYESRMHELESENRELRERVENLDLQVQLAKSEKLLSDTMQELTGAREEIVHLKETVTELQEELDGTEQTLQRTNQALAASVLVNILLAAALQGVGGRNAELQSQLEQLQEQHQALGIHSKAHDLILQRAQELTEATSPADLISKIEGLQEALASEKQRSSDLERRLQAANRELSELRPANQELRRDLQLARKELAEIADAVQSGRRSGETLPQLARRYHETIGRLEHQLQTTLQANRGLQQTIDGVRSELPKAPEHDADLPGVVRALRVAKEEAQQARQLLHEELEALKPQHSDKIAILDRIGVVLDKKGAPHESLPELVSALGEENQRLKQVIAQHVAAQSRLGEILESVGQLTGEQIETMEDLPGAVERALGRVEQRAVTATRCADSLQQRVSELTDELRETKSAQKKEIASKQEVIRKLEARAQQAESELEGQGEHVLDLESQADVLRQECGRLARALRETKQQHAEEVSGLKRELQSAQHDLAQERETTAALRKEVSALKQAARETEQRHQEALREQEEAHQRTLQPLRTRLTEVTHLNSEQATRIESLSEELEQEQRALSEARETGLSQTASIKSLTKRVAELEDQLEKAHQATVESDQRRKRELREQEETHQSVLQPLRQDVDRLTRRVSEQDRTIASLREDLERETNVLASARRVQKEQLATISSLTASVDNLEQALAKATEATKTSESARVEEREELQQSVTALRKELRTTQASLEEAESQRESQEIEVARLTDSVKSLQLQLDERAAISQHELETLRQETRRLKDLLGAIDSLARQVPVEREATSLADQLAEIGIGANFERLAEVPQTPEYTQLPKEVQEVFNALLKEIEELKRKDLAVRELEADVDDLRVQLREQQEETRETRSSLESRIAELELQKETALDEARIQIEQKDALIEKLRQTLARERSKNEEAVQERTERIEELEKELRESENARKALVSQLKQQGEDLQAERDYAQDLDTQVERLTAQKESVERTLASVRQGLQAMEKDRDSWEEEAGHYENKHSELLRQHSALQSRYGQLESEISQLRGILGTTFDLHEDADIDQFDEARRDLHERVEDMTSQIDVLSQTVARVEAYRAELEVQHEEATEERDRALRSVTTERETNEALRKELEVHAEQTTQLRRENAQLREALDAHRHSSAEQEEILQCAISQKAEEIQRLQEIEEARRREELDKVEQQQLRAADAGEIMGEIARGMDQGSLSLEEVVPPKMLGWIREYIQSMKKGSMPKRHAQAASSEISQLNSTPYPLTNLSLFTDFFQVTDHVSGLRGSREFLRLKANNAILAQLDETTQQAMIKRIKADNAAIIRKLLSGFFARVNEVAGASSGLSRFGNIGMQLWVWNTVFHGLKDEFYRDKGQKAELGFAPSYRTIGLDKADGMRKTVLDLHTRFQEMMLPFLTV